MLMKQATMRAHKRTTLFVYLLHVRLVGTKITDDGINRIDRLHVSEEEAQKSTINIRDGQADIKEVSLYVFRP